MIDPSTRITIMVTISFLIQDHAFCTTPTLAHPDPEIPFIVEVNASMVKARTVLSQHQGEPPVLHPFAFYFNTVPGKAELRHRQS